MIAKHAADRYAATIPPTRFPMRMVQDVREFMEMAGQRVEEMPQLPETRSQLFFVTIGSQMRDWAEQLKDEHTTGALRARFMIEEMGEICEALGKGDLAEYADGLIDMLYVVIGAGLASGIPIPAVWHAVQHANMNKFPACETCDGVGLVENADECPTCHGKQRIVLKDAQGKTIKPPGWKPPDIAQVLQDATDRYHTIGKLPVQIGADVLDTIHDGDIKPEPMIDILSLIGDEFRDPVFPRDSHDGTPAMNRWRQVWRDRIFTWTQFQRDEVAYWAGACHMAASDNGSVPYPPEVVRPFLKRVWADKPKEKQP